MYLKLNLKYFVKCSLEIDTFKMYAFEQTSERQYCCGAQKYNKNSLCRFWKLSYVV